MIDLHDKKAQEIAFSLAKGINGTTAREILERIGSVDYFFKLSQAELHNLCGISTGIFDDSYRKSLLDIGIKEAALSREKHIDTIFIGNDDYPNRLAQCIDAPVSLYKYGSCKLDRRHVIGIVGTRHATAYGIDFATRLVTDLSQKVDDLVVVSGLAYGIDVAAHLASLAANVPTVGVLAHGLSRIYPADHRQIAARMTASGGALVTEHTYATGPQQRYFLSRNRIIAGLSDCVVVVESDIRGGAMSTARTAMQYNRDVFAVPGRINDRYSQGTNKLIADHTAALIRNADDVIQLMGWEQKEAAPEDTPTLFRPLSDEERQMLDFITDNPDVTVNEICVRLNKSYASVTNIMLQLEMDDIITILPGGRYAPTTKI